MKNSSGADYFLGVDVQQKRRCPFAILDNTGRMLRSGWLAGDTDSQRCRSLCREVETFSHDYPGAVAFGIDAPRAPLSQPRNYYVDAQRKRWRERRTQESGHGRHCEVIIKSVGIANPQWTPLDVDLTPAKQWMQTGAAMFAALAEHTHVYEVFPSASYSLLDGESEVSASIDFSQFAPGPKDMLDAVVAAITVREYLAGRGCAVGDGDGHGTIVLPRNIEDRIPPFMKSIPPELLKD